MWHQKKKKKSKEKDEYDRFENEKNKPNDQAPKRSPDLIQVIHQILQVANGRIRQEEVKKYIVKEVVYMFIEFFKRWKPDKSKPKKQVK